MEICVLNNFKFNVQISQSALLKSHYGQFVKQFWDISHELQSIFTIFLC